jgi:hypothetical protein
VETENPNACAMVNCKLCKAALYVCMHACKLCKAAMYVCMHACIHARVRPHTLSLSLSADLHNLQFTVAHALGFSVSTSHVATDLNTETITSNHLEVFVCMHAYKGALLGDSVL